MLPAFTQVLGAEHWQTKVVKEDFAIVLIAKGRILYNSWLAEPGTEGGIVSMSDNDNSGGELDRALASFTEALTLVDRDQSPGFYGVILHDIAATHAAKGDREQAAAAYRESVMYKRNRLPDEPGDLATTLEAFCSFLIDTGGLAEARTILDQLNELLSQIPEGERVYHVVGVGRAYERLANRGQKDAYPEALKNYKDALQLLNPDTDPGSYASVLNDMGDVYSAQGELDNACAAYEQTVDHIRRVPGATDDLAAALLRLGRIQRRIGIR
jgi:tetratricopeptide (TPR) repeat protein